MERSFYQAQDTQCMIKYNNIMGDMSDTDFVFFEWYFTRPHELIFA